MHLLIIIDTASICCKTIEVVPGPQGVDLHLDGIYGNYTMELNDGKVQFVSENNSSSFGSVTLVFDSSRFLRAMPGIGSLNWHFDIYGEG